MLIEKGQDLLSQIRKENERIPDPKLSRLMDEMESITGKIYKVVEERPESSAGAPLYGVLFANNPQHDKKLPQDFFQRY